ncbi:hypothetical protein BDQ17DRAFT_1334425 [Cyathus striatus]|nr:hypothetical protein BDQ17DRAFT_1334425 [Cyathus striatus]
MAGVLANVTVDDSGFDPLSGERITYTTGGWKQGPCFLCGANPNKTMMYKNTWHDGSFYPTDSASASMGPLNAMFMFNGSAIYVFCTIAPNWYSNMSFYIDGKSVGVFEMAAPEEDADYEYNVLVYSNSSMTAGPHQFTLQNGQYGNGGNVSLTLLDYLIYSYETHDDMEPLTTFSMVTSSTMNLPSTTSTPQITTQPQQSSQPVRTVVIGVIFGVFGLYGIGIQKSNSIQIFDGNTVPNQRFTAQASQQALGVSSTVVGDEMQTGSLPPMYSQLFRATDD